MKPNERGVAFILVLWLLALLTILLGSFALISRTEALQARHLFDTTEARYAAEAGVNRAVYQMAIPDPQLRWIPDGRAYELEFERATLAIEVTDESGLIDLNAADTLTLSNLMLSFGLAQDGRTRWPMRSWTGATPTIWCRPTAPRTTTTMRPATTTAPRTRPSIRCRNCSRCWA
jgi:hypothetical protein